MNNLFLKLGGLLYVGKTIRDLFMKYGVVTLKIEQNSAMYEALENWLLEQACLYSTGTETLKYANQEIGVSRPAKGCGPNVYAYSSHVPRDGKRCVTQVNGVYKLKSIYVLIVNVLEDKASEFHIRVLAPQKTQAIAELIDILQSRRTDFSHIKVIDYSAAQTLCEIKIPEYKKGVSLDVCEHVVADLGEFYNSRQWYKGRSIKYKRSYLLYGPPGSGKSTFIQQLAQLFNKDVVYVTLNDLGNAIGLNSII